MFSVPLAASKGDVNTTIVFPSHANSDPVKVMIMRAGNTTLCWYNGCGANVTCIRTPEADANGGSTFTIGEEAPMLEAPTAPNLPFVPVAMIDPAEFSIAERILEAAGCTTLTVVTLNKSSCNAELLLIEKAPDNVIANTGKLDELVAIEAETNAPPEGAMTRPCAGLVNDHSAPTRVMTRTEGANAAGMFIRLEIKEMLRVVEDSTALFISCTTGCPASISIEFGTISTSDPDSLLKMMV